MLGTFTGICILSLSEKALEKNINKIYRFYSLTEEDVKDDYPQKDEILRIKGH
jgi:hypothetical protein